VNERGTWIVRGRKEKTDENSPMGGSFLVLLERKQVIFEKSHRRKGGRSPRCGKLSPQNTPFPSSRKIKRRGRARPVVGGGKQT